MTDPAMVNSDQTDPVEHNSPSSEPVADNSVPPRPDYARAYSFLLPLATAIILLDQWTKSLVRNNLEVGDIWIPWDWLAPYARIVHWHNTGAAFGMFKDFGIVFTVLAILVALAILYYFPQVPRQEWSLRLAMGFQLGGALGNLTDRLLVGQVTDFISVGTFPVFNIADASISLGVAVLIVGMWFSSRGKPDEHSSMTGSHASGDPHVELARVQVDPARPEADEEAPRSGLSDRDSA